MLYDGIFFDWDGTAVESRKAPTAEVCKRMKVLLNIGVKLFIISGTTYDRVAEGKIHDRLKDGKLENLYLGLGRGAHNLGFEKGMPVLLQDNTPDVGKKLLIDQVCFALHRFLYETYKLPTDIVFSRPNYCKVDVLVNHDRGEHLFLQADEITKVNHLLGQYGIEGGLLELIGVADRIGEKHNLATVTTTDAKYLEIGLTTKRDNVNYMIEKVLEPAGIELERCSFWGDEFTYLGEGIKGSDSFMMTEKNVGGNFFDVSKSCTNLPEGVVSMGGGVNRFLQFLDEQIEERSR